MKINKWLQEYKDCFPVGEGWRQLVTKLVKNIEKINTNVEVMQVKEKYGGLRFYISGGTEEIEDLIYKAERESYKICEMCGTRENVTTEGGWLLTLCKNCRNNK